MRRSNKLTVIALILGLASMGGCSSSEDPGSSAILDEASRLVLVKDEIQLLQCECAVQAGAYASVADCRADVFKLEPTGNAQCMRELFAANPLEAPMLDCNITELENLSSCLAGASCNEDLSLACLDDFDERLMVCPKGPGTLGDSFGIDLSGAVDLPVLGVPGVSFPASKAIFTDQNFYPGTSTLPFANLPTFTITDIGSLDGGTLTNVTGSPVIGYDFDVTSFTASVEPNLTYLLNYTATGILRDTSAGTPTAFDGATLIINVQNESHEPPDTTVTEPGYKQMEWSADASYQIILPGGIPPLPPFNGSTKLIAYDSFFDAALESCQDLPGDQLATVFGSSLDASIDELCRCSEDETVRAQCLLAKQDYRSDCLAQIVDLDPVAAEVTECLVEQLDTETDLMAGQACCENPGDFDCLSADPTSGNFGAAMNVSQCVPSDEARGYADAIVACLSPPPPPPPVFSDDPARCEPTQDMLASGQVTDFMFVSRSQKVDPTTGSLYKRDYLIVNLEKLTRLAVVSRAESLDTVQQFLFSLYYLDADPSPNAKDQCEQPGIVSLALEYVGDPPQYLQLGGLVGDAGAGLDNLDDLITNAQDTVEAFAVELVQDLLCPAFESAVTENSAASKFCLKLSCTAQVIAAKVVETALLAAVGCN